MTKGELEERILGLKGAVLESDYLKVIDDARNGFMTLDTARRLGKKLTNLKGKELIRWAEAYANAKNEKWAKRWLGDKK